MPGMDPAVMSGDTVATATGDVGQSGGGVSQLAGEFVYGDTGKALYYFVRQNGEPLDVSLASNVLLKMIRRSGGSDVTVTVAGTAASSISDTSALEFSSNAIAPIGTSITSPASRLAPDVYECRVTFNLDGLIYWTEPFRLAVVKFP